MNNWNLPLCDQCWVNRQGFRMPQRMAMAKRVKEKCCDCGRKTRSGIYMRIDPMTVKYPS